MPHLLDLFCGRGGWTRAALARGWTATGIDLQDHGYPANLILSRLPTELPIIELLRPDLIVASPPCEEYARHHLPWIRGGRPDEALLAWALSLTVTATVPVVVECSKFAARHFSGARHAGQFALWGDLPALLPAVPPGKSKRTGEDPAARAMIPDVLAGWLLDFHARRLARLSAAPSAN